MRRRLTLLALLVPLTLWGQNRPITGDTVEETPGQGLVLRTAPAGADVYVDGVSRGKTPLALNELGGAEYNIRLNKDGYAERRFKIAVPAKNRLVVSIELKQAEGQLLLTIAREAPPAPPDDPGVTIYADGIPLDTPAGTPVNLPAGYHRLEVRSFGWQTVSRSLYIKEGTITEETITLAPAAPAFANISINKPRFNPLQPGKAGKTELRFEVSAPAPAAFTVLDAEGRPRRRETLPPFTGRPQNLEWDGRDEHGQILPDGTYTLTVETPPTETSLGTSFSIDITIDSALNIYPLSIPAGTAGLIFAPHAQTIPEGSFQIEGGILFGTLPKTNRPRHIPYAETALRFSPLRGLETAAFLGITPADGAAAWGAGFSAKYALFGQKPLPVSGAAILSFCWAEPEAAPLLGAGTGPALQFPLAYRLKIPVSLHLSPGILWHEPWGTSAAHALIAGGILYQNPLFSAGISCRPSFDFKSGLAIFSAGAEIKISPPPRNFVIGAAGGARLSRGPYAAPGDENGSWTPFGGLFAGIIY